MFVFGAPAHLLNVKARLLPQCGDCVGVCACVCVCEERREEGGGGIQRLWDSFRKQGAVCLVENGGECG